MLVCEPRKIVSNVDRMAYGHLVAAGIIHSNKAGRPRVEKKIPKGRIGWKKLGPMRGGSCGQCGDEGTIDAQIGYGKHQTRDLGGHSKLCDRCYAVLVNSRKHWLANEDFPNAG